MNRKEKKNTFTLLYDGDDKIYDYYIRTFNQSQMHSVVKNRQPMNLLDDMNANILFHMAETMLSSSSSSSSSSSLYFQFKSSVAWKYS